MKVEGQKTCDGCGFLEAENWTGDKIAFICKSRAFDGRPRTILLTKDKELSGTILYRPAWCKI